MISALRRYYGRSGRMECFSACGSVTRPLIPWRAVWWKTRHDCRRRQRTIESNYQPNSGRPRWRSREITAVIDTGYNGSLTLPIGVASVLSLPQGASREVTLGDASRRIFDYYNAEIIWDGKSRRVRILCVEGDPLIGTQLLEGCPFSAFQAKML